MATVVGIGNCQVSGMIQCAGAALGLTPVYLPPRKLTSRPDLLARSLSEARVVFARGDFVEEVEQVVRSNSLEFVTAIHAPRLHFSGFQPDAVTPRKSAGKLALPMGNANSAILLAAWNDGLGVDEALSLFRHEVFEELGYYEAFSLACSLLTAECGRAGVDVARLMPKWMAEAPFFYVPLHPKLTVLNDIALALLHNAGFDSAGASRVSLQDELSKNLVWPVYPEIAARLGIDGDYVFRPASLGEGAAAVRSMDLETFVARTFAAYKQSPPDLSSFARMDHPNFRSLRRFARVSATKTSSSPYNALPDTNWWSRSVAKRPMGEVDPVVEVKFQVTRNCAIATAGSCFAQHISRQLEAAGFNYLITENAPHRFADPLVHDYGVFTARFGNVYTARQLIQLADRAYGRFEPAIDAWKLIDGGYVDPFRPKVGGSPFPSVESLRADRTSHFKGVREMFETADVFIFTLGLTECWQSRSDQAIVPLPPEVLGVEIEPDCYAPKNFRVDEVLSDLQALLTLFDEVNPSVRIILTVSPVPLIATFEDDHVLAATTYSKSVLRVAAGEIAKENDHVGYFPSYEIVTGSFNRGRYFSDDLRQVTAAGVNHVMTSFLRHYTRQPSTTNLSPTDAERFQADVAAEMDIICDEEVIELGASGSAIPQSSKM